MVKGFGFITCDSLDGDVLFGRGDLPADMSDEGGKFLSGRAVTFQAISGPDGRARAAHVRLVPVDGQALPGMVKSYSERHGYGFIKSSSVQEDIRFNRNDLQQNVVPAAGQNVTFNIMALPDGKLRASGVMVKAPDRGQMDRGPMMRMPLGMPQMPQMPQMPVGRSFLPTARYNLAPPQAPAPVKMHPAGEYVGVVKSYSEKNGYGFINVPTIPGVDIKFGMPDLAPDMQALGTDLAGRSVRFLASARPDGRLQARQLELFQAKRPAATRFIGGGPPAKRPRPVVGAKLDFGASSPSGGWLSGTVKSYSARHGFGFITSPGLNGDAFFKHSDLPAGRFDETNAATICGKLVSFELAPTEDGKLRVSSIMLDE
eukprot:CAMPEP_0170624136 /NCGR_PEP_ID=MMETSP0224-20130122/30070_1 /TAXON_ID=285029 /ORGANISM="Togula jolla, Strain CCCM 725" /LENGTH=371 /DNA_ID=CAMNT_0010950635 /DNA_START=9 /DNA_END=1121 /DNA_ORIENTATION=+